MTISSSTTKPTTLLLNATAHSTAPQSAASRPCTVQSLFFCLSSCIHPLNIAMLLQKGFWERCSRTYTSTALDFDIPRKFVYTLPLTFFIFFFLNLLFSFSYHHKKRACKSIPYTLKSHASFSGIWLKIILQAPFLLQLETWLEWNGCKAVDWMKPSSSFFFFFS